MQSCEHANDLIHKFGTWDGGGYSHFGLKGNQVGFRVLLNGYQIALVFKHMLPNRGILRFPASYKISTHCAPCGAMVDAATVINEFGSVLSLFHQFLRQKIMKNHTRFSLLRAIKNDPMSMNYQLGAKNTTV